MAHTNILTKSIFTSIDQAWQNVQFMSKRERQHFIKQIDKLNSRDSGFIHYAAKDYLKKLVDASEPYFNNTGKANAQKDYQIKGI